MPPRIPPPARTVVKQFGQWSRPSAPAPASLLTWPMRGVRPNSPVQDDQRFVEQPPRFEVVQQTGKREIGGGHQPVFEVDEIAAVRVPVDTHILDPVVWPEDRHQRNSMLDQAPRLQDRLSVRIETVAKPHFGRLGREIERPLPDRRVQQIERPAIVASHRRNRRVLLLIAHLPVDFSQQTAAVVEPSGRNFGGQIEVADAVSGLGRVGVDRQRIARLSEPAAELTAAFFDEPRHVAWQLGAHRNERWERIAPASQFRQHGSQVRPIGVFRPRGKRRHAGQQEVRCHRVVNVVVSHRPDDGQFVGPLRQQRKMLADADVRHFRGDRLESTRGLRQARRA